MALFVDRKPKGETAGSISALRHRRTRRPAEIQFPPMKPSVRSGAGSVVRRPTWLIPFSLLALVGCPGACDKQKADPMPASAFKGESIGVAVPIEMGFEAAWELNLQEWGTSTEAQPQLHEFEPNAPKLPTEAET